VDSDPERSASLRSAAVNRDQQQQLLYPRDGQAVSAGGAKVHRKLFVTATGGHGAYGDQ
jgi:hypothetical protein